jgi:hypothetical protein
LSGLDEGLIPRGFDDGPDEIYAIDFGSGGGEALLCFAKSIEGFRDMDKDRPDWMGFGGKGCLLKKGGGFRNPGTVLVIGGTWGAIGSIFMVFAYTTVRGGETRRAAGSPTETMVFCVEPVGPSSPSRTSAS